MPNTISTSDEIRRRIEQLQSRIDATDDEATAGPAADELHALLEQLDSVAGGGPAEVCSVCDHSRYVHDELRADHDFVAGDADPTAEHQPWCHHSACYGDRESQMHQSVTSSVIATDAGPDPVQLDVSTNLYRALDDQDGPTERAVSVWLRRQQHDGLDLTPAEARQLAQALTNHADLADGALIPPPSERAATLIISMLAHTGRDAGDLHGRVVALVESIVTAMAGAR